MSIDYIADIILLLVFLLDILVLSLIIGFLFKLIKYQYKRYIKLLYMLFFNIIFVDTFILKGDFLPLLISVLFGVK